MPAHMPPILFVLHLLASQLCTCLQGYAPLVVVPKKAVPWFDERIHDGNLGRQMHLQHMHALGLGFVVHPDAFVVKQPAVSSTVQQDGRLLQQAVVSSTVQQDSGQLQQAGLDSARGFNSEHLWQSDVSANHWRAANLLFGCVDSAVHFCIAFACLQRTVALCILTLAESIDAIINMRSQMTLTYRHAQVCA